MNPQNTAFLIRTVSNDTNNKILLYKLNPPTKSGTDYLLLRLKKIENKRFPDQDFINFLYCRGNEQGEAQGEWKRYHSFEASNEHASEKAIRQQYGGLNRAQIEEYRKEYGEKFKNDNREFRRDRSYYEHKLKDDVKLDNYEKNIYQGIIKVMDEVASGVMETPIRENPKIAENIKRLFAKIDDGYLLITKPKMGRKLELENKKIKLKYINALLTDAKKPLDWSEPPIDPTSPKDRGLRAPRSNRIANLEMGGPTPERATNNAAAMNAADVTTRDSQDSVTDLTDKADDKLQKVNPTTFSDDYNFKVIFACDQEGNLVSQENAYVKILWFHTKIPVLHISQQFLYDFLIIHDNKVLEPSFAGHPTNIFNERIQSSLNTYLKSSKFVPEQELLKSMKQTNGKLMTNGNLPQGVTLVKKVPQDKQNSLNFKYEAAQIPGNDAIRFIESSLKNNGGGLGSTLTKALQSDSDPMKDKEWQKDSEYKAAVESIKKIQSEIDVFTTLEQNRKLSEEESDARMELGIEIIRAQKRMTQAATRAKQKNQASKDFSVNYVDKGYKLLPSSFTRGPDKQTQHLDLTEPTELPPLKPEITVYTDEDGVVAMVDESIEAFFSDESINEFLKISKNYNSI